MEFIKVVDNSNKKLYKIIKKIINMNLMVDMLIRLKNGFTSKSRKVVVSYSRLNLKILKLLVTHGFVYTFYCSSSDSIVVSLRYFRNDHNFKGLKFISRPGRNMYYSALNLKQSFGDKSFVIISTTKGIMLHHKAIMLNLGGEVLFELHYC